MVYVLDGKFHDIAPDEDGLYTSFEFGVTKQKESFLVEKIKAIHPAAEVYTGKYTPSVTTKRLAIPSQQLNELKGIWEKEGFKADFASTQIMIISLWACIEHSVRTVLLETLNHDILNFKIAQTRSKTTDFSDEIVERAFNEILKRVQQGSKNNLFGELAITILGGNLKKLLNDQKAGHLHLHLEALYGYRNLITHGNIIQFEIELNTDDDWYVIEVAESKVYKQVGAILRSYTPDRPDPCNADGSPRWDDLSGEGITNHFWEVAREFLEVLNEAIPENLRTYLYEIKEVLDSGIQVGGTKAESQ